MTELSADAKRLLASLRDVDDPTPEERANGDAAVRRMLEEQGIPLPPQPIAVRSGTTVKLSFVVGAAVMVTLGLFGLDAWRSSSGVAAPGPRVNEPTADAAVQPPAAVTRAEAAPVSTPTLSLNTVPQIAGPTRRQQKPARDSLAEELRFLSSVDADVRAGAYDHALRRLQQHKGSSALQEERAAIRVLALCGRNMDGHAKREREQFLKVSPSSVLAARVRAACQEKPRP